MKNRIFCSIFRTGILFLILLNAGCLKPDRLPVFETEMRYQDIITANDSDKVDQLQPPSSDMAEFGITSPDSSLDLTVERAITLAVKNNRDLRIKRINPVIIRIQEGVVRGNYDPELFGDIEFLKDESTEAEDTGPRSTVKLNNQFGVIGLRQKLPTGTLIEASVGQGIVDSNSDSAEHNPRVGLTVTQSLLRGLGPRVNLVSLKQAQLSTAVSKFELRGITEILLAETEASYWDLVLASQKIDIMERSLAVALQQLDEIQQRIEVGSLPRIEAAAVHAEVALREQALINARSTLEEKRLRLLRLINPGSKGQFDLQIRAISTAETNPTPITDLDDRLLLAQKSRADLAEADLRLKQNRLETIMTQNGLLPRLDLFINLGKTGYADSFSDSFKDFVENNHDFSAGVTFSYYLNNRQAKARDFEARVTRHQAAESVENLKQLIDLDVRLAANEFERTRQQIAATRSTRLWRGETLKAEKERFDVGVSTSLLMAQAQRDLLISSIEEAAAIINSQKALIKLYLAEGSLLERRGIAISSPSALYR
jgi:outer membrane protein